MWVILRRSLLQIGCGALIGLPLAAWLLFQLTGSSAQRSPLDALVVAVELAAGIVVTVGLFACLVPTLRVVAIDADEALRVEG